MAFAGRSMDLAKLLGARPQTPTTASDANVFKFSASGPSTAAGRQRQKTLPSRSRQVNTKSLSKAAKKTDRRQEVKIRQSNRKDAGLQARRQIDISDEDSDEDKVADKPAKAPANGPKVDRMERLRKFKEDRKKKQEEERAAKKQPFRVGVYKLPSSLPASQFDTTKLGKSSNATFVSSTRQALAVNRSKNAFKAAANKKIATPSTTFTAEKSPTPKLPAAATSTPTLTEEDESSAAVSNPAPSEPVGTEALDAPIVAATTTAAAATPVRTGPRKSARRSTMFVSPPPEKRNLENNSTPGHDLMSFGSPIPPNEKQSQKSPAPVPALFVTDADAERANAVGALLGEAVVDGRAAGAPPSTPAAERGRRRTRRRTEVQTLLEGAREISPLAPSSYTAEVVAQNGELISVRRSTRRSPMRTSERQAPVRTPVKATKANREHPSPYATPKRSSRVSELSKSQPSADEMLFKTPTQSARSARVKSSLREVILQRGSSSDRRRRLAGKPLSAGHLVDLDLSDLPDDSNSPVHDMMRKGIEQGRDPEEVLKEVALEKSLNESMTSDAQGGSLNEKDAKFFRNLLQTETNNLRGKCALWEQKLAAVSDSEFAQEEIRSAIGMTEILMNKKGRFEQFEDLIKKFEFNLGENKVKSEDLQGFWDMLQFQVEGANKKFARLEELEKNGWVEPKKENVAPSRAKPKGLEVAKPKAKAKSSLRQMMEEKRRQMAAGAKNPNPSALTAAAVNDDQEKVFDAGFFTVRSPLRSKNTSPMMN